MAYLFFSDVVTVTPIVYDSTLTFVLLCLTELMFGIIFGFVTNLFLTLVFTAGQLIDMQTGFGMVNVFDVQSNISIPITGNILNITLLVVFFLTNGHMKLIRILYVTVLKLPVGTVNVMPEIAVVATQLFSMSFMLSLNVAIPIIFAGLLTEATLGIIVKSMPQLNVFSVGMPLKVLMGITIFSLIIPVFVEFSNTIFDNMFAGMEQMFATFLPVR